MLSMPEPRPCLRCGFINVRRESELSNSVRVVVADTASCWEGRFAKGHFGCKGAKFLFDAEYRFCEDWLRKLSWKHCRDCLFDSWKKPKSQLDPCHFLRIYMLLTSMSLLRRLISSFLTAKSRPASKLSGSKFTT
jgi:hypothetical protein